MTEDRTPDSTEQQSFKEGNIFINTSSKSLMVLLYYDQRGISDPIWRSKNSYAVKTETQCFSFLCAESSLGRSLMGWQGTGHPQGMARQQAQDFKLPSLLFLKSLYKSWFSSLVCYQKPGSTHYLGRVSSPVWVCYSAGWAARKLQEKMETQGLGFSSEQGGKLCLC